MNQSPRFDDIEYGDVFQIADIYNIPASVTIEVDTQCNMRCKHCYIPDHGNDKLQIGELDDIFRQLRKMGTFEIVLTGGEIFIRDDYMCPTFQHSFGVSAAGKVFPCNAMF